MSDDLGIEVTRDMDATVDRLWAAWRDPERMARFWGPAGFTSTVRELSVQDGGRLDVVMHGPDGTDYENVYVFDHVDEPRQLVYTNTGSEEFGLAPFQSVVDFEPIGNRTRVKLAARYASEEEWRKHVEDFHAIEGAEQLLERLEREAR